jgi:hypothetical protein
MVGGIMENTAIINDVITTKDGVTFQTLSNLPIAEYGQCLVVIDSEELFMTGGSFELK